MGSDQTSRTRAKTCSRSISNGATITPGRSSPVAHRDGWLVLTPSMVANLATPPTASASHRVRWAPVGRRQATNGDWSPSGRRMRQCPTERASRRPHFERAGEQQLSQCSVAPRAEPYFARQRLGPVRAEQRRLSFRLPCLWPQVRGPRMLSQQYQPCPHITQRIPWVQRAPSSGSGLEVLTVGGPCNLSTCSPSVSPSTASTCTPGHRRKFAPSPTPGSRSLQTHQRRPRTVRLAHIELKDFVIRTAFWSSPAATWSNS